MAKNVYPVAFGDDVQAITITPIGAPTSGKVYAIRVQDLATGKWYSWDNGVWDTTPSCTAGTEKLYVAFYAYNVGIDGDLKLELIETDTGKVLATKTERVLTGKGVGIESTTNATEDYKGKKGLDMPGSPYKLTLKVTP